MANIIACDGGCGKQSPDKDGRHVANHWWYVSVRNCIRDESWDDKLIFCADCYKDKIKPASKDMP